MAKITTIGDLSLVKSAMLIGKTGHRFRCLHIAAISFTLPAAKCQGGALPVSMHPILTSDSPTDIPTDCDKTLWHTSKLILLECASTDIYKVPYSG